MNITLMSQKLIKLRGNKSQNEVSKSLGISKSALSMYERGQRVPRDEIKMKLAQFYSSSIEEIFFNN